MIHKPCGPFNVTHTTTISPKCHHHTRLWANLKSQLYRPSTAKRFTSTKPPYLLLFLPQRMTFTYVTLRCLDITTLSNQLSLTPSNNPTPRFQVVAYLLHHNDAPSYGQRDCQRLAKLCGCQSCLKDMPSCCSGLLHPLPTASSSVCCFGFSV